MRRDITNIIRFFMDETLPSVLRDSRMFMYPFMYYAFKGKNVKRMMDFKSYADQLSDAEFSKIYNELKSIGNDRATDLNKACIKRILKATKGEKKKMLEVGCGRGFLAKKLIEQGHDVSGCDVLTDLKIEGLQYKTAQAESLPYADKSFDIVICTHTLEHVRKLDKAIAELKRVGKEKLIIVVPKQRAYKYTLDLHLHFFLQRHYLTDRIGLPNFVCDNLNGDWYYEANLLV